MHRFLRLIGLKAFRAIPVEEFAFRVREAVERMHTDGVLSDSDADAIDVHAVASLLSSDLGRRLIAAETLMREWSFTMQFKPGSPTLVQGIVDAAFLEDDHWILVDYKTDRNTQPEIFVPRHEMQMNWYRTAVERLTDYPVGEMWLFALKVGKAHSVRRIQVSEEYMVKSE